MTFIKKAPYQELRSPRGIHQGDCVHLRSSKDLFQVIGVDDKHNKCWLRKWPLQENGSPVFEIAVSDIDESSESVLKKDV